MTSRTTLAGERTHGTQKLLKSVLTLKVLSNEKWVRLTRSGKFRATEMKPGLVKVYNASYVEIMSFHVMKGRMCDKRRKRVRKNAVVAADALQGPVAAADALQGPVAAADALQDPVATADALQGPVAAADALQGPVVAADASQGPVATATPEESFVA